MALGIPPNPHGCNSPWELVRYLGPAKLHELKRKLESASSRRVREISQARALARLAHFPDGAGKWRFVVVARWLLQESLRPLHDVVIRTLRGLPQDCTFDQYKIYQWTQEKYMAAMPVFSLDLKNATDRLPLSLQAVIL